ncbi:hypothetical protein BDW71DRAFT_202493 [Aspergillus fruticulosus]
MTQPVVEMQQPTSPSHLPDINAEQRPGVYFFLAHSQATAAPSSQTVPTLSSNGYPYFPVEDWLEPRGIEPGQAASGTSLSCPNNLPSHGLTNQFQVRIQEPANLTPALSSYGSNANAPGEPLLNPTNKDVPVFRCEWKGCRSATVFGREADLIRHLKSVHIARDAYTCPEPNCDKRFGRKDHLKAHQKTHRQK